MSKGIPAKDTVEALATLALEHLLRATDRGSSSETAQADALTSIAASLYLLVKKPAPGGGRR